MRGKPKVLVGRPNYTIVLEIPEEPKVEVPKSEVQAEAIAFEEVNGRFQRGLCWKRLFVGTAIRPVNRVTGIAVREQK